MNKMFADLDDLDESYRFAEMQSLLDAEENVHEHDSGGYTTIVFLE